MINFIKYLIQLFIKFSKFIFIEFNAVIKLFVIAIFIYYLYRFKKKTKSIIKYNYVEEDHTINTNSNNDIKSDISDVFELSPKLLNIDGGFGLYNDFFYNKTVSNKNYI